MVMAFFSWWYGEGWGRQLSRVSGRTTSLLDMFSFDLLIRTFFSPYRQISAGRIEGPIGVQLHMAIDKLVSRFIGSMIRFFVLLTGMIVIVLASILGLIELIIWPALPWMPLIGVLIAMSGWIPWR